VGQIAKDREPHTAHSALGDIGSHEPAKGGGGFFCHRQGDGVIETGRSSSPFCGIEQARTTEPGHIQARNALGGDPERCQRPKARNGVPAGVHT